MFQSKLFKKQETPWNLLLLSDLHLGDQLPGESRDSVMQRTNVLNARFSQFLDYYSKNKEHGRPWRLIINGDFLDFMHVHIPSPFMESTEEISWHILDHTPEDSLLKLRQIFALHSPIFESLVRFLSADNQLVLVTGNHDAELNWPEIQKEILSLLQKSARMLGCFLPEGFLTKRVFFEPESYFEENRIYVEHGHLYDRYCIVDKHLEKHPQEESRRIQSPVHIMGSFQNECQLILSKLAPDYIENWSKIDYILFYVRLPFLERWKLTKHVASTTIHLLLVGWERHKKLMQSKLVELGISQQGMVAFSESALENSFIKQAEAKALYDDMIDLVRGLQLDKIFFGVLSVFLFLFGMFFKFSPVWQALWMTLCLSASVGLYTSFKKKAPIEPLHEALLKVSEHIASHPQIPLVVFGHSHTFVLKHFDEDSLYINLGAWCLMGELEEAMESDIPYIKIVHSGGKDFLESKNWNRGDLAQKHARSFDSKTFQKGYQKV